MTRLSPDSARSRHPRLHGLPGGQESGRFDVAALEGFHGEVELHLEAADADGAS